MLEVEDAQRRIIANLQPVSSEIVPLKGAGQRWLAQDVLALVSIPVFDNSAMDGYAVRAADVASASSEVPVVLDCIGSVPAGASSLCAVQPGKCVRVFTGSPLPLGADSVVMQEDTRRVGNKVNVLDVVKPWEHVRLAGEDIKSGAVILRRGDRITAARLAVLGATGVESVSVRRPPVVGILGTGNELVEPGQPLAAGQIYESNRAVIALLVAEIGSAPRVYPIVRDSISETRSLLASAFDECDCVITTGGVSVGDHDVVKAAFESLGGTLEFWKVDMKPGKPFAFGRHAGKCFFGLPGNPVSTFVTFLLLVRPALMKMSGATRIELPVHPGVLAEPMHNRADRRHFLRVCVDSGGGVRTAGLQASHSLGSLSVADGLLSIPPNTIWPEGQLVDVIRWGTLT